MTEISGWLLILCLVVLVWLKLSRKDDTDGRKERSGVFLYTDYATGLQYIGGPFGIGLYPRVDREGRPMRISEDELERERPERVDPLGDPEEPHYVANRKPGE